MEEYINSTTVHNFKEFKFIARDKTVDVLLLLELPRKYKPQIMRLGRYFHY